MGASYRDVFAVKAYRAVWLADLISLAGDRIARVGVVVLVYQRTNSALFAALTYVLSILPTIAGPWLAGIADRHPRRAVMIAADSIRAALCLAMVIPGEPLVIVIGLLIAVTLLQPPHKAARATMVKAEIFPDNPAQFDAAVAASQATNQISQLVGFGVGGVLAGFNPYVALAANALSFVLSAAILTYGVKRGSTPRPSNGTPARSYWNAMITSGRLLWTHPRLRTLAWLACLSAMSTVPEALAVPYSAELGKGAVAAGLLIASDPAGVVVGLLIVKRLLPRAAILPWMGPFAALSGVPLVFVVFVPPLPVSMVLFFLCGATSAYMFLGAGPQFQDDSPEGSEAGLMGWFNSGIFATQGLVAAIGGALASAINPSAAMAIIGIVTIAAGIHATTMWRAAERSQRRPAKPIVEK